MRMETPIIAILLGSLMFTLLFGVFTSLAPTYGQAVDLSAYTTQGGDTNLQEGLDSINQTKSEIDDLTDDIYNQLMQETEGGGLFAFFRLAWQIGKNIYKNINIFGEMAKIVAEVIGIPASVVTVLITILLLVFIISVIMILMGRIYT